MKKSRTDFFEFTFTLVLLQKLTQHVVPTKLCAWNQARI